MKLAVHFHTTSSPDASITERQIIAQCKKHSISCVGITDHNTAGGALKLKKTLGREGIRTIVGEEIMTEEGEIIGLFLKKNINCKKENGDWISLEEAVEEIKKQDGLLIIPHPFDRFRHGIGKKNLDKIKSDIDALEVFNSRTKFNYFNKKAQKYAEENKIIEIIGSDAHHAEALGDAIIEMEDFETKEDFLKNLKEAKFYRKRLRLRDFWRPTMNRIRKKIDSRFKI